MPDTCFYVLRSQAQNPEAYRMLELTMERSWEHVRYRLEQTFGLHRVPRGNARAAGSYFVGYVYNVEHHPRYKDVTPLDRHDTIVAGSKIILVRCPLPKHHVAYVPLSQRKNTQAGHTMCRTESRPLRMVGFHPVRHKRLRYTNRNCYPYCGTTLPDVH